jgi:hypothetical protein
MYTIVWFRFGFSTFKNSTFTERNNIKLREQNKRGEGERDTFFGE